MVPETGPEIFVGREREMSELTRALDGALEGRGGLVMLAGDPGIGKTRIMEELTATARDRGAIVAWGACYEGGGAPPYWPWTQAIRSQLNEPSDLVLNALETRAAVISEFMPEINIFLPDFEPAVVVDPEQARFRLFDSVTSFLNQITTSKPMIVVLDDLHWSDPASVLLARYAVRELRREPIIFVGIYRDTDVDRDDPLHKALGDLSSDGEVFRLEGLDRVEVTCIVEHVAGFEVSGVLAAALHAQTGGNPLFLVEVLRLLASEGRLGAPDAPTPEAVPLPATVRHTLQNRLATLSETTRGALEQAAVLGSEFDLEILEAAIQSESDLTLALDEAAAVRLIQRVPGVSGRFRFVHDLIRETLDVGLLIADRASLHRRAADAIVMTRSAILEDHFATLSHHYLESASMGNAHHAVDFAMRGAARATSSFSFELAVVLFERALRGLDFLDAESGVSSDSETTRATILIGMGDALWQSSQRTRARKTHQTAADLARRLGDPLLFAQAAIGLAGRNDVPMDFPDASVRLMEQALEALPRSDSRLRVRLLAHLVRAKYFGDEREQLVEWAREAVEIATRLDDPAARFAALEALHYALLIPAYLEERLAVSKQLPELARRSGSLRFEALAWLWRTFDLLEVPDVVGADAAIAGFEEAAHALRQPFYEWLAVGLRATRAQMEGRLDEAERLVFRAFELGQHADSPNALLFFGTQLFHLRVEQGRGDELTAIKQKIVDERPALPVFRIGIPLIHAYANRASEARQGFEQVAAQDFEDVPHDLHRLPMLTSAATVCAYLGDTRRAEVLLKALREEAGRIVVAGVATYWFGSIDRSLGCLEEVLGRLDEAERLYASAERDAALAGARLIEAHAMTDRARVLRRRGTSGDLAQATHCQERAEAAYRDLGVEWRIPTRTRVTERGAALVAAEFASNHFFRDERCWVLEFEGVRVELPDSKGLAYLQRLVASPDQEVHVAELIAPISAAPPRSGRPEVSSASHVARFSESPIEILDAEARRSYRERLEVLEALRNEAEENQDLGRLDALGAERDQIEAELHAAFGLAGRARSAGDPTERARKAVYNRIRASIRRIEREHSALGRHLARSVRTGTTCSYRPDRSVVWHLNRTRPESE